MENNTSSNSQVLLDILAKRGMKLPISQKGRLDAFVSEDIQSALISQIKQNEEELMSAWKLTQRINDIDLQSWKIPNATVGKQYTSKLDVATLKIEDIFIGEILGLKEIGLSWDNETQTISGIPTTAGTVELTIKYAFKDHDASAPRNFYSKKMHIVVNPDPRTLWKNLPSDKNAPFWKEDNAMDAAPLGKRNLVVCSKRGRSHQHKGTFRDDHYSFRNYGKNGWSVVAVSDGAGSAKYSREGSKVACDAIIDHFQQLSNNADENALLGLDIKLNAYSQTPAQEDTIALTNHAKKTLLYPAVVHAHEALKTRAKEIADSQPELFDSANLLEQLNDFHATLIFCLFKKFKYGYVLLTFGVGDCPIAVAYHDEDSDDDAIKLLNTLDVGEYGGGTRFITQPRIFTPKAEIPMAERFNLQVISNFAFLFLMTDGIYDPKFEVEANLEKVDHWRTFVGDLHGQNEDKIGIDFNPENPDVDEQLSTWMDFFSKGNHDDRTLAVVY